jgi:hypothetical protein
MTHLLYPFRRWVHSRLARDKHSTLLGPFVSYEENEVLRIQHLFYIICSFKWKAWLFVSPVYNKA